MELVMVVTIVVISIIFLYIMCWSNWACTKLKRAPRPFPTWPIFGHLPLLGTLPHHSFYNLSKTYGDIMELKLGSIHALVISSPEMAKEVLKTHDLVFASRPKSIISQLSSYGGHSVGWAPYGDHWRHMRKVSVLELFTTKSLNASKNIRHKELSLLVQRIFQDCKEGKPMDMQTTLCNASMNLMTHLLFGKSFLTTKSSNDECAQFKNLIVKEVALAGAFNISDFVPFLKPFDIQGLQRQMNLTRLKIDNFLNKIIQDRLNEKKPNESKDFLDVLLSLPGKNGSSHRLEDNTVKAVINESLMAGTDASATTIEWALVELLKHPKVMKKVQDELDGVVGDGRFVNENDIPQLKYLQAIVKETFRLHPPAPLLVPHESIESCEINGYHVPAKTRIFVNIWAIHRSLCAYENPLDFNPERFVGNEVDLKGSDFQLLPFGSGRRMCPALSLGLITVQMELAMLLHSFMWKLPIGEKPEDIDMGEVFGISTPKAIPLKVIATARLPSDLYVIP
ncbi:unnamed protein product [Sphagnum troendelagicum]